MSLLLKLEELKFLIKELPASLSCIDANGKYLVVNDEFNKYFLKKDDDVLGKCNSELFSAATSKMLDANNFRVLRLKKTQIFEEMLSISPEKLEYWLSLKKPVFNDDGEIICIIVFSFDITERKKMEALLGLNFLNNDLHKPITSFIYQSDHFTYLDQGSKTLSKSSYTSKKNISLLTFLQEYDEKNTDHVNCLYHFLDLIIYNFPGNVWWKDNTLKIKRVSKSQTYLLNLENPDDAIGYTNFDFCDPESARALTDLDNDIMSKRTYVVVEESSAYMPVKPKEQQYFFSKKRCVYNPITQSDELLGAAFDFTLRKKIEINFRKLLNKLYLEQEARDSFLANISHDIRTPITGMLGLIDDIKLHSSAIEDIQPQINTLKTVTNEFLDLFNGILKSVEENESDLSSTNKIDFNLADAINSCFTLFKPTMQDKKLNLMLVLADHMPINFNGNIAIIKRILLNLIGNAIKFTKQGHIKVSGDYKDGNLLLSIEDTGIGINEETQKNIFKRFTRGIDGSNYKGSGLGLYMVENYVDGLSGSIDVESTLNKGTTFTLRLPMSLSSNQEPNLSHPSSGHDLAHTESFLRTILIVEDNRLAALALKNMIEKYGDFAITIVESGKEAIAIAKKEKFRLIFLDLGLPDISGLDVLKNLRAHAMTTDIPIYILSGHINSEMHSSCINAGANNTYAKPMTEDVLKKTLA